MPFAIWVYVPWLSLFSFLSFFSGCRQLGFPYRLPGSAIAYRQFLRNAWILGISLEPLMCFANEMEWMQENGRGWGCVWAELGEFQVASWSGSLSFTIRQYFSLRKRHFTVIWADWERGQQRNIKHCCPLQRYKTAQKKSWMWDLHTSQNTRGNSTWTFSGCQGFNWILTAISIPKQCRVCQCRFIGCRLRH